MDRASSRLILDKADTIRMDTIQTAPARTDLARTGMLLSLIHIYLLRLCDVHNIPIATNIATAEMLIHGLERGDLDWRAILKS